MEQGLVINWENLPTYNTIMALAAGAALISLAKMVKDLLEKKRINPLGWAINLGVLGLILFATGLHMTLAWPLAPDFPYDNIVFGEPSLALGVMALAMAIYFWTQREKIISEQQPIIPIAKDFRHLKYILYGIGLALIATGIAGVTYQLFAAPPEEPISGWFAEYPLIEATFISLLWAVTGLAALTMPGILDDFAEERVDFTSKAKFTYSLMYSSGWVFLFFGAMNYFTHIGLIVNTMPK